ncbi:glycosyltransferase family 2 protein [Estrella lausannensis]|uniref:Glycosyl transferase n=1 Tax=Estrella lausannensis TaxID=483423 RepID=A0A0H5E676_9BACT|nr:glycosyltransferase family 2 protein [Estrella lausannensis]CRX38770.1 Glycosyl transferase [Estrella lausannensis]
MNVRGKTGSVAVIIVTHNSERFIYKAWESLEKQTKKADKIVIVDSGSKDKQYLAPFGQKENGRLILAGDDIGFCKGNNIGYQALAPEYDYILLLNPDAFLFPDFIEKAVSFMEEESNKKCGAVSGTLLGYDIDQDKPTGRYDSTGIFRSLWGSYGDRGQGKRVGESSLNGVEEVPAICGALMFLRAEALAGLGQKREIFDESFFMYKEDIDLSFRLRRKGWSILFNPKLSAYHCRGWNPDRSKMPRQFRLCSAVNEMRINWRMRSPLGVAYSSCKYLFVKMLDL